MKILIIGTGYVGLVTGTCFAEMGNHVTCLDIDESKIAKLKEGQTPFYEPGLQELLSRNIDNSRIMFSTSYSSSIKEAEICFICVPTPANSDGSANLTYVLSAAKELANHMTRPLIIVNKSTSPVGTSAKIKKEIEDTLKQRNLSIPFDIVSNPEFLKEGDAVNDFMKPDRIILGTDSSEVQKIMQHLYAPFSLSSERIFIMDIPSAELTKYAANAMLATRISFMNEIAKIAEQVGADIHHIRKGIGSDKRIGYHFLYAGVGYGGSCFPKDVQALQNTAKSFSLKTPILEAVEQTNQEQRHFLLGKIKTYFSKKGGLAGKTIAIWGLSFKPNTDDIREAPALFFIEQLLQLQAHLHLYDPIALNNAQKHIHHANISWYHSEIEAAHNTDAILLLTEWKQLRVTDLDHIIQNMQGKAFFDGRNQYNPQEMASKGFDYISIGRPSAYSS